MLKRLSQIWLLGLAFLAGGQAVIQYAGGTNVNAQCTATAGTKQELSDCIEDNLNAAGWTTISGHHTSTVLVESLITPTASLQMRLQLTQGTNCVILKGRNVGNTKAATTGQFLLPAVSKVFRVIANKYQYFVSTDGSPVARSFAAGGVLYVPSFTGITEAIWTTGNATSDTDTNINPNWKVCLSLIVSTQCGNATNNSPSTWVTVNGTQWDQANTTNTGSIGFLSLIIPVSTGFGLSPLPTFYRWFDNSSFITEPIVGWGSSITTEGRVVGQLWDAAILTDSIASETSLAFDSHNWLTITNSNAGLAAAHPRGTLVVVIP